MALTFDVGHIVEFVVFLIFFVNGGSRRALLFSFHCYGRRTIVCSHETGVKFMYKVKYTGRQHVCHPDQ